MFPELSFNIDHGYLEGLVRGFKSGILRQADYLNLVQCETLEGKRYFRANQTVVFINFYTDGILCHCQELLLCIHWQWMNDIKWSRCLLTISSGILLFLSHWRELSWWPLSGDYYFLATTGSSRSRLKLDWINFHEWWILLWVWLRQIKPHVMIIDKLYSHDQLLCRDCSNFLFVCIIIPIIELY